MPSPYLEEISTKNLVALAERNLKDISEVAELKYAHWKIGLVRRFLNVVIERLEKDVPSSGAYDCRGDIITEKP